MVLKKFMFISLPLCIPYYSTIKIILNAQIKRAKILLVRIWCVISPRSLAGWIWVAFFCILNVGGSILCEKGTKGVYWQSTTCLVHLSVKIWPINKNTVTLKIDFTPFHLAINRLRCYLYTLLKMHIILHAAFTFTYTMQVPLMSNYSEFYKHMLCAF